MSDFLQGDPGDEGELRFFNRRFIPVLWTDMRLTCWDCGHKWVARVCMEKYDVSCPDCGAHVAIPLPKEPRKRIR